MSFFFTIECFADQAITYELTGGRLGDTLLAYLHAKWISHKYNIPLVYRPFPYSSDLFLDEEIQESGCFNKIKTTPLTQESFAFFEKQSSLKENLPDIFESRLRNALFVCPYFPETEFELNGNWPLIFKVDWKDKEFRTIARKMISPKKNLNQKMPSKDKLNIALHIREGGGFDFIQLKYEAPHKFPPIDFYVKSLNQIVELFKNVPIYCYIFTDALDPTAIVNEIKNLESYPMINFEYRTFGNHHNSNVLDDFFSLFNFDVLIRPESNFSIIPSLLQDYIVVCSPKEFIRKNKTILTKDIKIDLNKELFEKFFDRQRISLR